MSEPHDGQPWPGVSPRHGLISFDSAPFGCLRFSSAISVFPLSIAFPGWTQPVINLDDHGFGMVDFPGAFAIHRSPIPATGSSRQTDLQTAIDAFSARCPEKALQESTGASTTRQSGRLVSLPARLRRAIPLARVICVTECSTWQEIFFRPRIDESLWSFRRRLVDLDDHRSAEMLQSIVWLDEQWFRYIPLNF